MDKKAKKFNRIKIILIIVILGILTYFTIKFFPIFKDLSTPQGRESFKLYIQNLGTNGIFVIIGLMIIQILLAFLPGEPVEILAGMCYGPVFGTLIIFLASFLSSALIFFLVKKFGRAFIYGFVSSEKVDKIEHSKLFSNPNKLNIILFLIFFTPGTPKDLFVYIAGLLPVNPTTFLLISTLARFPSVISSTIAGSSIINGDIKFTIITYLVSFAISGLIILFSLRIKKNIINNH